MYIYTIMPDIGMGEYAWMKKGDESSNGIGSNVGDAYGWYGNHLISNELASEFVAWTIEFERETRPTPEENTAFDWSKFHARGLALCWQLKTELGADVTVIYEKPIEDPNCRVDERQEVLQDGSLRRLRSRRRGG